MTAGRATPRRPCFRWMGPARQGGPGSRAADLARLGADGTAAADFASAVLEERGPLGRGDLRGQSRAGSRGNRGPILYAQAEGARLHHVDTGLVMGDEDWPCIEPNIFLEPTIPNCGLWMHTRTGQEMNLEEPAAFNRAAQDLLPAATRGRWSLDG